MRTPPLLRKIAIAVLAISGASCDSRRSSGDDATADGTSTVTVSTMTIDGGTPPVQTKGETGYSLEVEPVTLTLRQKTERRAEDGILSEIAGRLRHAVTTTEIGEVDHDRFELLVSVKNGGELAADYASRVQPEYLIDGTPVQYRAHRRPEDLHQDRVALSRRGIGASAG